MDSTCTSWYVLKKDEIKVKLTVVPGLPHRLMEDDVYKGMFIPKGSLVFGNIWYAVFVLGSAELMSN